MTGEAQIKSHRDLIAWQKAMDLVVAIYELTKSFPREEIYGLTSQLRRAAVSIPANVAEGQGRRSKPEFRRFLGNARGSLLEVDSHLELALRLEYLSNKQYADVRKSVNEVGRIINGLLRSLASNL